jgi:hypothetical protein
MRRIKDCTLIAIDTLSPGAAISSLRKSMAQCEFDEVILFTNIDIRPDGIRVILIPEIKTKDQYSEFILKFAGQAINTDFVLVTQHDSWILNADCFDDRLYNYDYAGALWLENDGLANGNGGFSWRSKKLIDIVAMDDHINATAPEDVAVCRVYRRYLEKNYDLKWAPDDICEAFSFELRAPYQRTFGFHGFFHEPYRKMVVIKRLDAMGDAISVEPVLEYFHRKGYRVVLETLPQFETLFHNHYFPLLFPHQIDPRVLATAKYYDLTMSYESNPKQLHLESYYDFCEVPKEERIIRNPKLNFVATPEIKIFKQKYAVIHIDRRSQPHRNVEGVAWWKVTDYLKSKGYLVVQIGKNEAIELDAIQMNTIAEPMLAYVISGCDIYIGVDSGPSHIAVATGRKCVLFFGSVFPWYIHADPTNIRAIHNHDERQSCRTPFCWHNSISTTGQECIENKEEPPCCKFSSEQVINAINELI